MVRIDTRKYRSIVVGLVILLFITNAVTFVILFTSRNNTVEQNNGLGGLQSILNDPNKKIVEYSIKYTDSNGEIQKCFGKVFPVPEKTIRLR